MAGKKAEGLSLQVVVIAAIALIVLLIVLGVFKGGIDRIVPGLSHVNDCEAKNGHCSVQGNCKSEETEIYGLGCETKEINPTTKQAPKPACCIPKTLT